MNKKGRPRKTDGTEKRKEAERFVLKKVYCRDGISPGSEIDVAAILQDQGINSAVVREVEQQLIFDGALLQEPTSKSKLRVVHQDQLRIQTLLGARMVTEGAIVMFLTQRVDKSGLVFPAQCNEEMRKILDAGESAFDTNFAFHFVMLDLQFHRSLAEAQNNSHAKRIISEAYHSMVMTLLNPLPKYSHAVAIVEEHCQILEAIRSSDITKAIQQLHQHLTKAVGRWLNTIPEYCSTELKAIFSELAKS